MAGIIITALGRSGFGSSWTDDLGVVTYTAGKRVLIACATHGPAAQGSIASIEWRTPGSVPTGSFFTRIHTFEIPTQAYFEFWEGVVPSTRNDFELFCTASPAMTAGSGRLVLQTNSPLFTVGVQNSAQFGSSTTWDLPDITTDARSALIFHLLHTDAGTLSSSFFDDGFTTANLGSRVWCGYKEVAGATATSTTMTWGDPTPSSEAGEAYVVVVYADIHIEDSAIIPNVPNQACTVSSGGGQGGGGCVNAFPTIGAGAQEECAGGGLVPTQADLVHSEAWWGRA